MNFYYCCLDYVDFQHNVAYCEKVFFLSRNTLLGKVLRIDVDSRTGNLPYGIPPDNPFNNGSYPHPEIYALGLRNPWRAGMDAGDRETGLLVLLW